MKLSGTIVFFVDKYGEDKKRVCAHTSISREWKDEESKSRVNRSIDIEFGSTHFPEEKVQQLKENTSYTMEVEDGWLTLNRFHRKDEKEWTYKIVMHIAKGRLTKATAIDPEKRAKALEEARAKRDASKSGSGDESPIDLAQNSDLPF